jgi:lipopolysaccharide export system protein LptA
MYLASNKLLSATLLLPFFLILWAPACFAERADRNEPMHLEADQVIMDDAQQISTFIGNVRLSQGTLLIRGDKIVVEQDKNGIKQATAYGNTAEFRQKREGLDGYVEGYGESIEYDARTGTLNFHKKARLKRDQDEVSGDHITYNAKTEIFKVDGSDANSKSDPPQRVRAVLQPNANKGMASPYASGALPVTPRTSIAPTQ